MVGSLLSLSLRNRLCLTLKVARDHREAQVEDADKGEQKREDLYKSFVLHFQLYLLFFIFSLAVYNTRYSAKVHIFL